MSKIAVIVSSSDEVKLVDRFMKHKHKYLYDYFPFPPESNCIADTGNHSNLEYYKEDPYCTVFTVSKFLETQNWCVAVTPHNREILNKWRTAGYLISLKGYVHHKGYGGVSKRQGFWTKYKGGSIEISMEEFKKYILKQNAMENKKISHYQIKKEFKDNYKIENAACVISNNQSGYYRDGGTSKPGSHACEALKAAGVLDLWFEPVYEPTSIKINIGNPEFAVEVIPGETVKFGSDKFSIERIKEMLNMAERHISRYPITFNIGCKSNITRDNLKRIVDVYYSK